MKELFKNVRSLTSVAFLSGIIVLIQACNAGQDGSAVSIPERVIDSGIVLGSGTYNLTFIANN